MFRGFGKGGWNKKLIIMFFEPPCSRVILALRRFYEHFYRKFMKKKLFVAFHLFFLPGKRSSKC